jgi:hypothetical protein
MLKETRADIKQVLRTKIERRNINALEADLDTTFGTWSSLGDVGEEVGDVVPRVTVQASAESLLVKVVSNKTNATSEDEETVQDTHSEVVLGLFSGESTRVAEQVDEANSNTSVNVEDKVILLGGCDGLNSNGVVEELVGGEVLCHVFLNQLDTEIGVVTRLDFVTNTGN